ncbi:MAG: KH domain-containing protein, partial [Myxococcota bacterium]|nr:KH domain-containing protein [Myxococcota bacterium]
MRLVVLGEVVGTHGTDGSVKVRAADGGRVIELETSDDDRGRVIGRQGRVAKAMRAVVNAAR